MEILNYDIPKGEYALKDLKKIKSKSLYSAGAQAKVKCVLYEGEAANGNKFLLPVVIGGKNSNAFLFFPKTKKVTVSDEAVTYYDKNNKSMTHLYRYMRNDKYGYNYGDVKRGKDSFQCSMDVDFIKFYKKTAEEEKIKPLKAKQASADEIIAKAEGIKKTMHEDGNVKMTVKFPKKSDAVVGRRIKEERVARRA